MSTSGATPTVRVKLTAEGVAEVVAALKAIQLEAHKTSKSSAGSFELMSGALGKMTGLMGALGIAISAAGFTQFIKSSGDAADNAGKLAQKLGTTTENASALAFSARRANLGVEEFRVASGRMSKAVIDLGDNVPYAIRAFRGLNITAKDFKGVTDTSEQLELVAKAMARMKDDSAKAAIALLFFGESGQKAIPWANDLGTKGLPKIRQEAAAVNVLFSGKMAAMAATMNNDFKALGASAAGLGAIFSNAAAPGIRQGLALIAGELNKSGGGWANFGVIVGNALQQIAGFLVGAFRSIGDAIQLLALPLQTIGDLFHWILGIFGLTAKGVNDVDDELYKSGTVWRTLGQIVSDALNAASVIVQTAFKVVLQVIDSAATGLQRMGVVGVAAFKAVAQAATMHFLDAAQTMKDAWAESERLGKEFEDRTANRWKTPTATVAPAMTEPGISTGENADPTNKLQAEINRALASADATLAIRKARIKEAEEVNRRAYAESLITLEKYYRTKISLVQQMEQAELDAIAKKRAEAERNPDPNAGGVAVIGLDAQAGTIRSNAQIEIANILLEKRQDAKKLARDILGIDAQIEEIQGLTHKSTLRSIEQKIEDAKLLLKKNFSDSETMDILSGLREALTGKEAFDELERQAARAMDSFELAKSAIDDKVAAGLITQRDGEKQLLSLERDRANNLRGFATAMLDAANATGNPETIKKAQEFSRAVRQIEEAAKDSDHALVKLRGALEQGGLTAMADFLNSVELSARGVGDGFRKMALDVVGSIRKIASEMLARKILAGMIKLARLASSFVGGGGGSEAGSTDLSGPQFAASGGLIDGPGTETSDDIPVWLSRREFVVRAAVVKQPGILEHLHRLNAGLAMPELRHPRSGRHLAAGGLVGDAGGEGGGGSWQGTLGLEEGLVMRHLDTEGGHKVLLKMFNANRNALKAMLK